MFEKRLGVVRFPVITFRLIFAAVAKMFPTVKALVKMAFPEMYNLAAVPPMLEDVAIVKALIPWVFINVDHIFGVPKSELTNMFPPTYRVAAGGVAVPMPKLPAILTRERVPVFMVAALTV